MPNTMQPAKSIEGITTEGRQESQREKSTERMGKTSNSASASSGMESLCPAKESSTSKHMYTAPVAPGWILAIAS